MSPHIVANGDDLVDDDARVGAFPGDLAEELPQRAWTVRDERVVLDVRGTDESGDELLRLLLVDHQIIEAKDVVLVANSAAVIGIKKLDHG